MSLRFVSAHGFFKMDVTEEHSHPVACVTWWGTDWWHQLEENMQPTRSKGEPLMCGHAKLLHPCGVRVGAFSFDWNCSVGTLLEWLLGWKLHSHPARIHAMFSSIMPLNWTQLFFSGTAIRWSFMVPVCKEQWVAFCSSFERRHHSSTGTGQEMLLKCLFANTWIVNTISHNCQHNSIRIALTSCPHWIEEEMCSPKSTHNTVLVSKRCSLLDHPKRKTCRKPQWEGSACLQTC